MCKSNQKYTGGSIFLFIVFITIFLFVIPGKMYSQVSRSVYFLEHLPESSIQNPAFNPPYKFYINLPVVSTMHIGFESPFSYDDLTKKYETGDSLYIDRESIMGALKEVNYFSFEIYDELARGGFRINKHFFHLSIAKVFSTKFSFEKDLARLLLYGNGSDQFLGKQLFLSKTGINMTSYHEFALGYSYQLNEKWTFGTRLKYLNGLFNVWTEKAEFRMYTDDQSNFAITASSNINIHTSSTISDFDNLVDQIANYGWFDLTKNHGYAGDIGVEFQPDRRFKVSASIVDIGRIKWKENIQNFKSVNPDLDYTFEGFDITNIINGGAIDDSLDILDTLASHFELEKNFEPYKSRLNPKVFLGGLWNIDKKNQLGLLFRTDFLDELVKPSVSVNYTHKFGDILTVCANYSLLNRSYANIGLGFACKFGPVQFYILNDMAYGLLKPKQALTYNFHFGLSLVFGTPNVTGKKAKIDAGEIN